MLKIKKIENDEKNITVNDAVMPAVFVAVQSGDLVRIVSTVRSVRSVSSQGLHRSQIEINGEVCESANDAVRQINSFIGAFKQGGGGVSPFEPNGSYSLDEVKTAETWIDGKPIYKKTFNITSTFTMTAGTWTSFNVSIDNIKDLVKMEFISPVVHLEKNKKKIVHLTKMSYICMIIR
jgi:hypothetical protein